MPNRTWSRRWPNADARVGDLIDADSNQGIGYARDDVDGDS